MDVKKWLSQKLDEPWSGYRLVTLLSNDIFDAIIRKVDEFDETALCRILLSILHLRPAQVREMHSEIEALLQRCSSQSFIPTSTTSASPSTSTALSQEEKEGTEELDWLRVVARILKGFTKDRCIDDDVQHQPEILEQVKTLLNVAAEMKQKRQGTPVWMCPAEAQYFDVSLCPTLPNEHETAHFRIIKPFQVGPDLSTSSAAPLSASATRSGTSAAESTATVAPFISLSKPAMSEEPFAAASIQSAQPPGANATPGGSGTSHVGESIGGQSRGPSRPPRVEHTPGGGAGPGAGLGPGAGANGHASGTGAAAAGLLAAKRMAPFKRKAAIKVMGLVDAAQLQDRIRKRTRPTEEEVAQRKKSKEEQKLRERQEREAKKHEEREARRRKKEEEKEAKRVEKEAVREQRMKEAADLAAKRARQKEDEKLERLTRQTAAVVMRQNAAQAEAMAVAAAQSPAQAPVLVQAAVLAQTQMMAQMQQQQQQQQQQPFATSHGAMATARVDGVANGGMPNPVVVATALQPPLPGHLPPVSPHGNLSAMQAMPHSHLQQARAAHAAVASAAAAQQLQQQQQQQQKQQQQSIMHALFAGANRLSPENRLLIERFLTGQPMSHPDVKNGILQVTLSENRLFDASSAEFLEVVVFEMNFNNASWRKLKRRRRIATNR